MSQSISCEVNNNETLIKNKCFPSSALQRFRVCSSANLSICSVANREQEINAACLDSRGPLFPRLISDSGGSPLTVNRWLCCPKSYLIDEMRYGQKKRLVKRKPIVVCGGGGGRHSIGRGLLRPRRVVVVFGLSPGRHREIKSIGDAYLGIRD